MKQPALSLPMAALLGLALGCAFMIAACLAYPASY